MYYYVKNVDGLFVGWDYSTNYWIWTKNPVAFDLKYLKKLLNEFITNEAVTITTNHF